MKSIYRPSFILNLLGKVVEGLPLNGDSSNHLITLFGILYGIPYKSRPLNVVELGVRNCETTLPLLLACYAKNTKLMSVDIDCNCKDRLRTENNNTSDHVGLEKIELKKLSLNWEFINCDAITFLQKWDVNELGPIDFIYIDDFHSYEHVKKELDLLDTLITPSTIILIHDLMYGNTAPNYHTDLTNSAGAQWANGGPYRAVAELNPQFWEFSTIPYNNGLTLLRKKYSSKYNL